MIEIKDDSFLKYLKKCSREVAKWPCWKRRSMDFGGEEGRGKPCKDITCHTCHSDAEARGVLTARVTRLQKQLKKLRAALDDIAKQKTMDEIEADGEEPDGDLEDAYETMIEVARRARGWKE